MANIYVRKSGNDSNDGSTPALAKLTIASAISVASTTGDIIWLGSGIYREQSLTTGSKDITIYGDITGENTGDAGQVIWSGMNSDDDTYTACDYAISSLVDTYSLSVKNISFHNFRMNHGKAPILKESIGNLTVENCSFLNIFISMASGDVYAIKGYTSSSSSAGTITLKNIYMNGVYSMAGKVKAIYLYYPNTSDGNLEIKNCFIDNILGESTASGFDITWNNTIIDKIENLEIKNITSTGGGSYAIYITNSIQFDLYNCTAQNILGYGGSTGFRNNYASYAYNCSVILSGIYYISTYVNYTESNSTNKVKYYIDYVPKESKYSPLKGQGSTLFPTTDIEGNPRPAYGNGTACDIGAVESTSDIIQKESTIKDSGDYSVKVAPCNYFKKVFQIPVTASTLRTVKVKIRIDGTWGTYLPRVSLSGQGMTLSQATKNSTTGSFEELTVSGTPTTNGIALLTVEAHSTSTDAIMYLDTITIE